MRTAGAGQYRTGLPRSPNRVCQVRSKVRCNRLAVDRRQTAAGVRDRPYQAGAGHWPPVLRYAFHPVVARSSSRSVRRANQPFCTQPPRTRACAAAMNIQLRGGTIPARQVAPQLRCCVQRYSLFCAVRGFSSSVGRRSGHHGPDYPRAHRLGFGLAGSDSPVRRRRGGDCSASCYEPLGRLSFTAVSSRHPVGVGW